MKLLAAFSALLLCSCYQTNFATTERTARISGKMAPIHTWMFQGESHSFITKIDGKEVSGTRTFTVDAGKRVIEAQFTGAGQAPTPTGTGTFAPGSYTGGHSTLTPILEAGHTYKVASGTKANSRKAFVYDVTEGTPKAIFTTSIEGQ